MVLEDEKGNLLGARIAADGQWRFPHTDSIPEKFEAALIEFEEWCCENNSSELDLFAKDRAIEPEVMQGMRQFLEIEKVIGDLAARPSELADASSIHPV